MSMLCFIGKNREFGAYIRQLTALRGVKIIDLILKTEV